MSWRDKYNVHPAADVFPMMSDDELKALGEDIKANGLRSPIVVDGNGAVLDGRNRLEAAERAGVILGERYHHRHTGDPVALIISLNIRRRHLTPQQQLDLIVAARMAADKPGHDGPVSKGGRGKVNPVKAAVIADAKAAGLDPSERTVKRAIAKAEGKEPKPRKTSSRVARKLSAKEIAAREAAEAGEPKPKKPEPLVEPEPSGAVGDEDWNELVRQGREITGYRAGDGNDPPDEPDDWTDDDEPNTGCNYDPADPRGEDECASEASIRRRAWLVMADDARRMAESFTAVGGHRAIVNADPAEIDDEILKAVAEALASWMRVTSDLRRKQASTLPQDGRSEVPVGDITSEPSDDFPEIPAALDRRRARINGGINV